jgi:DNA-binding transcriptional MocR family regulator
VVSASTSLVQVGAVGVGSAGQTLGNRGARENKRWQGNRKGGGRDQRARADRSGVIDKGGGVADNRVSAMTMARLLSRWESGEGPLHACLADAICQVISSGRLRQGTALPSQRELAQALAVSRTTVATAYQNLCAAGWLGSRQGGSTWVRQPNPYRHAAWQGDRLVSYAEQFGPLDLTSGTLPASPILRRILSQSWPHEMSDMLDLDGFVAAGWPELRDQVAAYFAELGLPTKDENLAISNGAHHSLVLVANALVAAGDTVLVEDPTYRGVFDVLGRLGARPIGVRTDRDGIDPDHLIELVRAHNPRLLYVMPAAHNATGITWTTERRQAVAKIADRFGLLVLDDASTIDLQLGRVVGPLGGLLPEELSVTLGSTTKLFWAGLRVGWVRGPVDLVNSVLRSRVTQDLAGSLPSQVIATRCLRLAVAARTLRRGELVQTRASAVDLLSRHLPQWQCEPADGSTLWVNTQIDATSLSARLRRHGILLNAGPTFSSSEGFVTFVRIPLGHMNTLAVALPMIAEILAS